jgi:predicted ATP-dependent endonuclease of OLD family
MRIRTVGIKNFRALQAVTINFDTVTTLIGPNGAGKSTVLRALDWFFNGAKNGDLADADCSFGAIDETIEVRVTFNKLTEKDREALGKYAPADVTTFTAWKTRTPDGAETFSANAKGYPPFKEIREMSSAADKKAAYNALRGEDSSLGLPAWSRQDDALETLVAWEADHTDQLVAAPETQLTKFFGFNSGGKMSDLFDFVLVTGDLRASEEAQDAKSSIIGRILERSVDRAAADEEIAKIVEESRLAQQRIYAEKFTEQLAAIKSRLNSVVTTYSPGRSIEVEPAEVQLKAPNTSFNVSVIDGTAQTPVERQGHGFQRTLLVSALQVLAESTAATTEGVICLAIEEPELFQHPTQAQAFARVLRSLADDSGKRIQVTYATHSPYFLEARHFDQIRRLTRTAESEPVVTVHASSVEDVKNRLTDVVSPEVVDRQLDTMTGGQLSSALFSTRALVVEGTTESAIFYGIGDREAPAKLESEGMAVVSANGKGSVPLAHAVLTSLGIPTYAVFDADSGFESRARVNGKSQQTIDADRTKFAGENRRLLKYFHEIEVDFPAEIVGASVAIFGDHLEAFLTSNWSEWASSCEAVEVAAGVSLKKNQLVYRTVTSQATGTVPLMLTEILARVKEV